MIVSLVFSSLRALERTKEVFSTQAITVLPMQSKVDGALNANAEPVQIN